MVAATRADEPLAANARVIEAEMAWLESVMAARFAAYADKAGPVTEPPSPPSLARARGPYAALVRDLALSPPARLVLALALAPYVAPERLDPFMIVNSATGRRFTEFGGVTGQSHAGFLPTAETAVFLLSGSDRARRIAMEPLFAPDHGLARRGILVTERRHPEEPPLAAALRLSAAGLHQLLRGDAPAPAAGADFPASLLTTPLDWQDLVLDAATMRQVEMIGLWLSHGRTLMQDWGLARRLKPGYRCLFHGEPGTGKTLTASLLGKRFARPVYRIDISRVVSKWIGETEKNLATLFDQAEDRDWILFFDEADALFGKRSESGSANDRAANQQIAYLLQRLETYSGLAILATNQHRHLDEAFARRFQASVRFPMPDAAERLRLWQDSFAGKAIRLAPDVDFQALADGHELAGGAIINVLRHACLLALARSPPVVRASDVLDGVRRELQKEGRYLTK
jgi:hypothetical protein